MKNPAFLTTLTLILLSFLLISTAAGAQEQERNERRELIYTFIGPSGSFGYNIISYRDWFNSPTPYSGTKPVKGIYFSGGAVLSVFGQRFIGDFTVQFMYNSGGGLSVYHLYYSSSARYNFRVSDFIHIAPGAGLYLETPPSNREYQGSAGVLIPIGFYFNTTFDTKLFADFSFRYGIFGLGEDSRRLAFGITLGFIFKVGRI